MIPVLADLLHVWPEQSHGEGDGYSSGTGDIIYVGHGHGWGIGRRRCAGDSRGPWAEVVWR